MKKSHPNPPSYSYTTNAMLLNRLIIFLSVCILGFICKTKVQGSCVDIDDCPCEQTIECGENAICDNDQCKCETGFFDFPPLTVAVSDGCLGEFTQLVDIAQNIKKYA